MIKEISVKAPARICLFGDHQDYLGLPVIACAIDKFINLKAKENDSRVFNIQMPDIGTQSILDLNDNFQKIERRNYFASAIRLLRRKGIKFEKGFDLEITGKIPINAGLSSSSALSAAWLIFLLKSRNMDIKCKDLAQMIYHAEVTEHGEPGGNMDQFSISFGGTQFIQTRPPFEVMAIEKDVPGLIIANSGIEKKTLDVLKYAKQKGQEAMEVAQKKIPNFDPFKASFQDVKNHLMFFNSEEQNFLTSSVLNHDITRSAILELKAEKVDWEKLGALMTKHHWVLSKNLNVSPKEIDDIVVAALQAGALGAKLVGSGGGGCVVAIAPRKEEEVMNAMLDAGAKEAFKVNISAGAFDLNFN